MIRILAIHGCRLQVVLDIIPEGDPIDRGRHSKRSADLDDPILTRNACMNQQMMVKILLRMNI